MSTRAALIVGGSRGIGLATAARLLEGGMAVTITGRDRDQLAKAEAQLAGGERVQVIPGSMLDAEHRGDAVARVIDGYGSLDVLVNCAGINPAYGQALDTDPAVMTKVLTANVVAPLAWVQSACAAWMTQHGGAIVNVASIAGLRPQRGLAAYAASKAALLHLTRQLAFELGPSVRVNAVAPALVRTRFASALYSDREEQVTAHYPLGRIGEPDDVAAAVWYLVSDNSSWVTGTTLTLDGGLLVHDAASVVP